MRTQLFSIGIRTHDFSNFFLQTSDSFSISCSKSVKFSRFQQFFKFLFFQVLIKQIRWKKHCQNEEAKTNQLKFFFLRKCFVKVELSGTCCQLNKLIKFKASVLKKFPKNFSKNSRLVDYVIRKNTRNILESISVIRRSQKLAYVRQSDIFQFFTKIHTI